MQETFKYEVAISFAEEDRNIALSLSQALDAAGLASYYYPDNKADMVGIDLEEKLTSIYRHEAKFAVVIFSDHYFRDDKPYVKTELTAIQNRMEEDAGTVYMLPVKVHKDVSLKKYPELDSLTYLLWNHNPGEIADILKELLGKTIVDSEENPDSGQIVFNNNNGHIQMIAGSKVEYINTTVIYNNTETTVINKVVEDPLRFEKPTNTEFICPNCFTILNSARGGKIECPTCGKTSFVRSVGAVIADQYRSLTPEEARLYNKIRAHIRNKLLDKNYTAAVEYCKQAEEIAPNEVTTWEHFALAEFLLESSRLKFERKSSFEIIKSIKSHIEKCKECGISDENYDELVGDIADRLFYLEKSRINSLRAQYQDELGYDKWTRQNFQNLQILLRSYEICYSLYSDTAYLEEYINELAKPNKWIEKIPDEDTLKNTKACGGFNAVEKFRYLVAQVKKKKPDYIAPEIAEQRMEILKEEEISPENPAPEPDPINHQGSSPDITIISIE